jgi:hypothetical protein
MCENDRSVVALLLHTYTSDPSCQIQRTLSLSLLLLMGHNSSLYVYERI